MHPVARRTFPSLAALLALLSAAGCTCGGKTGQSAFPAGAGIQENLSLSSLVKSGWNVCYEDNYGDFGTPIASILEACQGTYMMLACRSSQTDDVLKLAAADLRSVVTQPDAEGAETHHASNGVGWYFTDKQAWGFFPAGQGVKRDSCDAGAQMKEKRLCWHAYEGALQNGFRCGDNKLGSDKSWRRMVLVL